MKYWVGITDNRWFGFLSDLRPDEVNFWQPGGRQLFKAVPPGAPFLFKLRSPRNFVVGGGFLVRSALLPLSIAWDAFGPKNGAPDRAAFAGSIIRLRRGRGDPSPDPVVGCIVLTDPFFFGREDWVPIPADWSPNIVQGRSYSTDDPTGAVLWAEVVARLGQTSPIPRTQLDEEEAEDEGTARYGAPTLVRPRVGQGAFRVLVTEAYGHRCAITGERTLPILQAGHIKPYAQDGPNAVSNGLLLRSDLHILFDRGYLTVTPDLHVRVSPRIREEYGNGRDYYALDGRPLAIVPADGRERPAERFVEWHNRNVYAR